MVSDNNYTVLSGTIYNPFSEEVFKGEVTIKNGLITDISRKETSSKLIITTGFIDSHNHIESSLLVPSEYARLAVRHGVIGSISDPHEIANVMGIDGVMYMIANGKNVPFHFFWGAPSCVPATDFETSGGKLSLDDVKKLLNLEEVTHLSEVMNVAGVLSRNENLHCMINHARHLEKPVDAHAPKLTGEKAKEYFQLLGVGINFLGATDHECSEFHEASEKLTYGATIAIREGSAAKNFNALHDLLRYKYTKGKVFLCSDDIHPDYLSERYIDNMIRRLVESEVSLMRALQAASSDPVKHYNLNFGRFRVGDSADLVVLDSIDSLKVVESYVRGQAVFKNGKSFDNPSKTVKINNFSARKICEDDLKLFSQSRDQKIQVIEVIPGELFTNSIVEKAKLEKNEVVSDTERDIIKLVVVNRYDKSLSILPSVAFVKGMGLKFGALASSVSHDSHNIICAGVDDKSIVAAINSVIDCEGGLTVVGSRNPNTENEVLTLPLPIAGLMSDEDGDFVSEKYKKLDQLSKDLFGSKLPAPFMTLSFLALLVIPSLKLSDKGLFNGNDFKFTSIFCE